MVPSLLFAAALTQVADNQVPARVEFFAQSERTHWNGATHVPLKYPVLVDGDPPHLRGYPWYALHPPGDEPRLVMSVKTPQKQQLVSLAPVKPSDPAAERIKALEWGITALRARGGSQESIDHLQRELDALKKK